MAGEAGSQRVRTGHKWVMTGHEVGHEWVVEARVWVRVRSHG